MTHENIGKTSEAGKAELEHFDVEEAIKEVRRLGKGLIEATRHAKHRFREEWLEQLIDRYRQRPGKPVIHLDDLDDEVVPTLSPQVRDVLYPHWRRLVEEYGYMRSMNRFMVLRDIVATAKVTRRSRLGGWRRLARLTGFRVNELEPYVTAIRADRFYGVFSSLEVAAKSLSLRKKFSTLELALGSPALTERTSQSPCP